MQNMQNIQNMQKIQGAASRLHVPWFRDSSMIMSNVVRQGRGT